MESSRVFEREDYQIGVVCALPFEQAAVLATLDGDDHPKLNPMSGDENQYSFGRIGDHNVVVACLPAGSMGATNACNVATNMQRSFPIKFGLMVGIAGGVWSEENDVHLGDVVVSQPHGQFGGVVQYDFGKNEGDSKFKRTSSLNQPPKVLLQSLQSLQTHHLRRGHKLAEILEAMFKKEPHMTKAFGYPGLGHDQLFDPPYNHESGPTNCDRCDPSQVPQGWKPRDTSEPQIHYGTIGSANQVMRSGLTRDMIAKELGVICFEMEAAGLMNSFPCLVIRGISDYADTHKNNRWQKYAAATAAAFAKDLLSFIPKQEVVQMQPAYRNVHWIVPRGSSSLFTGRASTIEEIEQSLCYHTKKFDDKQRRFVIIGIGGIGKSEICLKVAENVRERFWGVFWVDVSSTASAERGFLDIARTCKNPQLNLQEVKQWLAATPKKWLLVLDNADDPKIDYTEYFPAGNRGCIILTTRNRQCFIHNNVGWCEMGNLDRSEAIQLLLKTTCTKQELWGSYQSAAGGVVDILGSHTFAIVQAGSFIHQGLCSLTEYPNHFKSQRQRLLQFRPVQAQSAYRDVYATFEVSAKHLEDSAHPSAKNALALLRFLAFLHFEDVPISSIFERGLKYARSIVAKGPQADRDNIWGLNMWHVARFAAFMQNLPDDQRQRDSRHHRLSALIHKFRFKRPQCLSQASLAGQTDTLLLNEACAQLASFSIVGIDETTGNLSMHPLARDWASDRLEDSEKDEAREIAGCILALSFKGSRNHDPWFLELEPHVESYLSNWPVESSVVGFEVVQFLYLLASLLVQTQSLSDAKRILQFLIKQGSLKVNSIADISVSYVLASCYTRLNDLSEAEALLEGKFETYKAIVEPGHFSMLNLRYELGGTYAKMGRHGEAIQLFEDILQSCLPEQPLHQPVQFWLGQLYFDIGEPGKGISLLEKVVQIYKSMFEPEHPDRLASQQRLARSYLNIGYMEKAISILEEVVQIRKKTLRVENTDRLGSEGLLGKAYVKIGKTTKGVQMLEEAVQILNTTVQPDHPARLCSQHRLAISYLKQGEIDRGISLLEEVVRILNDKLQPGHPSRLESQHDLAKAYLDIGKTDQGVSLLEKVVRIRNDKLPPDNADRLDSLYWLARSYIDTGDINGAIKLLTDDVRFDNMNRKPEDRHWEALEKLLAEALSQMEDGQQNSSSG